MNKLSIDLNSKIQTLVDGWNANLPRAEIVFVQPDMNIYPSHRFCEPGITEPQAKGKQNNVAFFLPRWRRCHPQ